MTCTRQAVIEEDREKKTDEIVRITIDGDVYKAAKGMTVLQVMRKKRHSSAHPLLP